MELLEKIFLSFFQASLAASVFILVVIFILKIFNNRLNIRVKNALWILVLIKLLIPVVTETNTNLFNILYEKYVNIVQPQNEVNNYEQASRQPQVGEENYSNINNGDDNSRNTEISTNGKIQENNKELISFIFKIVSCIWITGVLVLSLTLLISQFNFKRKTKKLKDYIDIRILTLIKKCRIIANVKSRIPVYIYDSIKSPCTLGIIKPKIYIPKYVLNINDDNQLSYIFLHELTHYKRKDLIYNFFSIIVLLIHWFNPLVWLAVKKMRMYRECACDSCVLELLNEQENTEYGMTLLNISKLHLNKSSYSQLPVFFETKNQIKDRIWMIKGFKKGSYKMTARAVLGCVIAAIVVLTNNLAVKALNAENIIETANNMQNLSSDYKSDSTNNASSNDKISMKESQQNTSNDEENNITSTNGKWVQDNGKWYYYNSDNVMLKNVKVDGYTLGEDGALVDSEVTGNKDNEADKTVAANKTNESVKENSMTENTASSNSDTKQNISSNPKTDTNGQSAENNNAVNEDNHISTDDYKESDKRWKKEGSSWTFTKDNGQKVTGWLLDKGDWYYFNKNGIMEKNTTIIDNDQTYKFRADGTQK